MVWWPKIGDVELSDRLVKGSSLKRLSKSIGAEPMVPPLVGFCPLAKDSQ